MMIRVLVLLALIGGVVGVATHIGGADEGSGVTQETGPSAPHPTPAPSQSDASLTEDQTGLLLTYNIIAGDALVARFADDDMESCAFEIHEGPATGSQHAQDPIRIEYRIVPVDTWEAELDRLGQPCSEYWYAIER